MEVLHDGTLTLTLTLSLTSEAEGLDALEVLVRLELGRGEALADAREVRLLLGLGLGLGLGLLRGARAGDLAERRMGGKSGCRAQGRTVAVARVVWTAQWHEGRAAAVRVRVRVSPNPNSNPKPKPNPNPNQAGYQDAVPAVLYLQQLEAAALGRHGDAHRAGVEAVLQVRVRVRLGLG